MKTFLCILFFLCVPLSAAAETPEEAVLSAADNISRESMDGVRAILEDFDFREAAAELTKSADGGILSTLWEGLCRFAVGEVRASLSLPLTLSALAALSGVLGAVQLSQKGTGEAVFFLLYALFTGLAIEGAEAAAAAAHRAAEDMGIFTQTALPALAVMSASLGGVSAAAVHPVMLSAISAASLLVTRVGMPTIYISLALSVVGNLSGRLSLRRLAAFVRRTALWLVCGSFTIFSAILGVTGYAAGTLDGVAVKTAKYAAGSLVPVLGGLLSDAAEAVASGALAIKNAAGAAGMIFLILLILYPLLRVMAVSLLYRLSAAVTEPVSDARMTAALSDTADALAAVGGMTAAMGVLSMICMGILLKSGDIGVMLR